MYPELFHLGPFVISSFGFMMVVAFGVAYYFIERESEVQKWPPDLAADMVFWAALGGIAGAKIYYLIENIGSGTGSNIAGLGQIFAGLFTLNFSKIASGIQNFGAGLVFFGSLIGGMLAVTVLLRRRGVKWMPTADALAPYLILWYAIVHIGCFLFGD
ncbi:MAG: prolipoprotein diacylglyceryl transferase, partial [Candidatus Marinimicrobia bacterium]|nr:prolipoprotein diacylglyceryl transferase [Candidatus Neomarinimicrobiota bacterium]